MLKKFAELRKRYQRTISIIFGVSVIVVYVLHSIYPNLLSFETATTYTLGLVLWYILLLLEIVEKKDGVLILPNRDITDDYLLNYEKQNQIRNVRMILYCRLTRPHLEPLLLNNAEVHLLLQHPDCMVNDVERTSFRDFVNLAKKLLPDVVDISNLHIFLYQERTTYRAITFDNKLIVLSWYTYEYRRDQSESIEEVIWGRRQPNLIVDSSLPEFSDSFSDSSEMIEREFDMLLNSPLTITLDEFLEQNLDYI